MSGLPLRRLHQQAGLKRDNPRHAGDFGAQEAALTHSRAIVGSDDVFDAVVPVLVLLASTFALSLAILVVWWLALAFGWEEFLVAAAVLSAVIVLCVAFLFGRTSYDIELDLTRTHVVVGERAVGELVAAVERHGPRAHELSEFIVDVLGVTDVERPVAPPVEVPVEVEDED